MSSSANHSASSPDHPHTITWDTISALNPTPHELHPQAMATAHQITAARLKAADSGPNGTTIDLGFLKEARTDAGTQTQQTGIGGCQVHNTLKC